jgi:transcriptional regulator with XRE-family HTH domain
MRDALDKLRGIPDPAERARSASALIDDLASASSEASHVRLEALAALQASGMNQSEIAAAAGMSRARISQVMKAGPPPGRALVAAHPGRVFTVAVAKKPEGRGNLSIVESTLNAFGKLADLAASYGLKAERVDVPPPGLIEMNTDNLAVLIGPRMSALIVQAVSADPVIRWQQDALCEWYITDTTDGTDYHSDFDAGSNVRGVRSCYAHMGRIRRPDGQGSFLYLGGAHAPGTAGAVEIFTRDTVALWEQAKRSLWSAVARTTVNEDGSIAAAELVTPVYVHGKR